MHSGGICKLDDLKEALAGIDRLTSANTKKVSVLGARAVVLSKFLEAALPHLRTSQRAGIARSSRQAIEETVSLTDDVCLPAEYHSALLHKHHPRHAWSRIVPASIGLAGASVPSQK